MHETLTCNSNARHRSYHYRTVLDQTTTLHAPQGQHCCVCIVVLCSLCSMFVIKCPMKQHCVSGLETYAFRQLLPNLPITAATQLLAVVNRLSLTLSHTASTIDW
jgi:hypothetical protein